MVSECTVPARGGRSCEHFGGYKTINRIPLPLPLYIWSKIKGWTTFQVMYLSVIVVTCFGHYIMTKQNYFIKVPRQDLNF